MTRTTAQPEAIRSQRVLVGTDSQPRPATVWIRGGRIHEITAHSEAPHHVVDLGAEVLMPGIVDTHAHINEPGRTDWEGFQTATRAAAAGGITSVVDMPLNSIPATTSLQALHTKADTAHGKCTIDYGFWGGVVPGNASELEPMVKEGVLGFKCFLIESGVDEFKMSTEKDLLEAMPILARLQVPLLVHAELEHGTAPPPNSAHAREYRQYLDSRPASWEVEAIRMVIRLAKQTRCHVHIVHLSAADALPDIHVAKRDGVKITVETCPHYLFFDAEKIADGATHFKCAPPIRSHANRERLWKAVIDGTIDFIVSDHSPCTPQLKKLEAGDFEKAWGGIAGLQFSLPVVWTEMRKRGLSLRDLSDRMSARTAAFAGLAHHKGLIAPGMDADLIAFDPDAQFTVEKTAVLHKHDLTPYEGTGLYGKVSRTYLRGHCVYDRGQFPSGPAGTPLQRKH